MKNEKKKQIEIKEQTKVPSESKDSSQQNIKEMKLNSNLVLKSKS